MLLGFPSRQLLKEALVRDLIPAASRTAAALAEVDDQGRIWIQTSVRPPRRSTAELRCLGVLINPRGVPRPTTAIQDWLELLPLEVDRNDVPSTVLFHLSGGVALSRLVAEMERVGHQRHAFRWLPESDEVLLRVSKPSLFTLLRAEQHNPAAPRAYGEQVPGVFVRVGFRQPLGELIEIPPGQLLFIDPPNRWRILLDEPYRSTIQERQFEVVGRSVGNDRASVDPIHIGLSLVPSRRRESANLWILRTDAEDRLETLVREMDQRQLERFDVAMVEQGDQRIILLRGVTQHGESPVLVVSAEAYASVLKFPNLFAPANLNLTPPLRRDVIRSQLAADLTVVTWLEPRPGFGMGVHSVMAEAFQPLSSIVEHTIEHDVVNVRPVEPVSIFHFETFAVTEEPKPRHKHGRSKQRVELTDDPKSLDIKVVKGKVPELPKTAVPESAIPELSTLPDAALQERLALRQRQYLGLAGPPDDPARVALLSELADLHAAVSLPADAAWCWLNLLWFSSQPAPDWLHRWLRSEQRAAAGTLDQNRLDSLLTEPIPLADHLRQLAAHVIASLYLSPLSAVMARMNEVSTYLERYDHWLPVRAAWLTWLAMSRLTGNDVLMLARARDRLLGRLLISGLSREIDLPMFLRGPDAGTLGEIGDRDQLRSLYRKARQWRGGDPVIIDLTFAFAFARIGESVVANDLIASADGQTPQGHRTGRWLLEAYRHRITAAQRGESASGYPPRLLRELSNMTPAEARPINLRRRVSRILEPFEKVDPFREFHVRQDDRLGRQLDALAEVADPEELSRQLGELRRRTQGSQSRWRVIAQAITYAPRIGEAFAIEVLNDLVALFPNLSHEPNLFAVVEMLEIALLLAAHVGRDEQVVGIAARLESLLIALRGERLAWVVSQLHGHLFRTLARVGLRDEVKHLTESLTTGILDQSTLKTLRTERGVNWGVVLRALALLASGWFYLEDEETGTQILNLVDWKLGERTLRDEEQANLAVAYATVLGQTPPEVAWPRIHDLFDRLGRLDVIGANVAFHQCEMRTIEAAVLSVISKEFSTGTRVRRWLDEDEFLIRKRIHADFAALARR